MKTFTKSLAITFAAAFVLSAASTAARSESGAKGGAADLVGARPTQSAPASVTRMSHCAMAKSCPDCRDVTRSASVVESKGSLTKTLPVSMHLCPECKTTVQTTGHGKAKTMVSTHTCEKAAGKVASCCSN